MGFGSLKVAEETNQGREHLAGFSLVDRLHYLAHVFDLVLAHRY